MTTQTIEYDNAGPFLYKDPGAVLDYAFDWTAWLDGDEITTAVVTVDGATKIASSNDTTTVVAWVSAGKAGTVATINCPITTATGRQDERSLRLKIKDR